MEKQGAVICFQKYNFSELPSTKIPYGHICLGYFGRMDVCEVDNFKDYMRVASEHGAELQCSRKQILIYQLNQKYDRGILVRSNSGSDSGFVGVPFRPTSNSDTSDICSLCCCTVVNISNTFSGEFRKNYVSVVAEKLWEELELLGQKDSLHFAITGVLGTEDLCVILLSNKYESISSGISAIQKCKLDFDGKSIFAIDNTHSILTISEDGCSQIEWGVDTYAEIYFSLKTIGGIKYIQNTVVATLENSFPNARSSIELRSWLGEYDVVLRCPAYFLNTGLFYNDNGIGLISYDNEDYRKAVYQSETIIYPFGTIEHDEEMTGAESNTSNLYSGLFSFVQKAIKTIRKNILGAEEDPKRDLVYIESAIYRLLKDFHAINSYPYSTELCQDLGVQFKVAIGAICKASEAINNKKSFSDPAELMGEFIKSFDTIATTLSVAMQATGQFDRLSFDEQPSYLLNVGSYHKILQSYYGIIKKILKLLYSVDRDSNGKQNILVPILSFGQTPIIKSRSFSSVYNTDEKDYTAELICITLPYQALANPPKYLGILVHELFHYSAPPCRNQRNRLAYKCAFSLAICEFISLLATGIPEGRCEKGYALVFRYNFADLIEGISEALTADKFIDNPSLESSRTDELNRDILGQLTFSRNPTHDSYKFYLDCWAQIRKMLLNVNEDYDSIICYIFELDHPDIEGQVLNQIFQEKINTVISFNPLEHLLLSYTKAYVEVAPDISDLRIVLAGEPKWRWAEQYFWQITSIRGDLQFGINASPMQADDITTRIFVNNLDSNIIRIGIVLSYCLGAKGSVSQHIETLRNGLAQWCIGPDNFLPAQEQFRYDYQTYLEQFGEVISSVTQLCDLALSALEPLPYDSECAKIINVFSSFYKRYYSLLEARQKGTCDQQDFDRQQFALCIEMIECYQTQIPLEELCKQFITIKNATFLQSTQPPIHLLDNGPQVKYAVDHPADFARAIKTAYDSMLIGGKIPSLWYRGQRVISRPSYPNIMRKTYDDGNGFFNIIHEEIRLARSQILPFGQEFCQAEWLAFLQHNEFKTNILDFSEEFYPALYFAIERWIDNPQQQPKDNACIEVFNPLLFNLAMAALDARDGVNGDITTTVENLETYLKYGLLRDGRRMELPLFATQEDLQEYENYFNFNAYHNKNARRPCAALVPKNSERMKKQSGQFVFYDLHTKPQKVPQGGFTYQSYAIRELHEDYLDYARSQLFCNDQNDKVYIKPFLFQMEIKSFFHMEFINHIQAIGLCKHRVYPEYDKLAKDLISQLNLE